MAVARRRVARPRPPSRPHARALRPVPGRVVASFRPPLHPLRPGPPRRRLRRAARAPRSGPSRRGRWCSRDVVGTTRHVVVTASRSAAGSRTRSWRRSASAGATGCAAEKRSATTGGRGPHHGGGVLHFGLRIGDTYVDPMQLFAPTDLGGRRAPRADGRRPLRRGAGVAPSRAAPARSPATGPRRHRRRSGGSARPSAGADRHRWLDGSLHWQALPDPFRGRPSIIRTPVIPRWCRRCSTDRRSRGR